MKKSIRFIIYCSAITLIFTSCLQPVDHDLFLKDGKVQNVIEGNGGDTHGLLEGQSPELELDVAGTKRVLGDNEVITISISVTPVIIRVNNASVFDPNSIEWYRNQTESLATVSPSYNLFSGPIAAKGSHTLTVIAEISGILYNTSIMINVVD